MPARTFPLILLLLLVSFPALADDGLRSLGDDLQRFFTLVVWFLGSAALLTVGFITYARKKKGAGAFLVYFSLVSILLLHRIIVEHFLDRWGQLLSDPVVHSAEKDGIEKNYWTLIAIGCVIVGAIIAFGIYHWKSSKRGKPTGYR